MSYIAISEFDAISKNDLNYYCDKSNKIKNVKLELDKLENKLKIATKVGRFDNFYDREAPLLITHIYNKKMELLKLIKTEKNYSENEMGQSYKVHQDKNARVIKNVIDYSDNNLNITMGVLFFAILFQFVFNYTFMNKNKASIQNGTIEALESRFKNVEEQNQELKIQVASLQKKLADINLKRTYPVKRQMVAKRRSAPVYSTYRHAKLNIVPVGDRSPSSR